MQDAVEQRVPAHAEGWRVRMRTIAHDAMTALMRGAARPRGGANSGGGSAAR
jgi:hypothetical protein